MRRGGRDKDKVERAFDGFGDLAMGAGDVDARPSFAGVMIVAAFTLILLATLFVNFRLTRKAEGIVVVLPVTAAIWVLACGISRSYRTRPSRDLGLCWTCGYDLRASPERCPECGAKAPAVFLEEQREIDSIKRWFADQGFQVGAYTDRRDDRALLWVWAHSHRGHDVMQTAGGQDEELRLWRVLKHTYETRDVPKREI